MAIDPGVLAELDKRRREALASGGPERIAKRHEQGRLSARERLEQLYAAHTFQEFGLHAQSQTRHFGMGDKKLPTDGVITGVGYIDGRPVAGFSQDFMVAGGSLGKVHAQKICTLMDHAGKGGMPVVGFNDSGGARIQDGVESMSGYGQVLDRKSVV